MTIFLTWLTLPVRARREEIVTGGPYVYNHEWFQPAPDSPDHWRSGVQIFDMHCPCMLLLVVLSLLAPTHALRPRMSPPQRRQGGARIAASTLNADLVSQCDERWRDATLDHFTWVR